MSRILALANIKGGVGKTTSVVNLSAALAERGYRVLAIDLDPQSSLTLSMGMKPEQVSVTIRQMLEIGSTALWPIHETDEGWDFIPTNVDLRALEHELETNPHRIPQVAAGLNPLREKYDFILLDCPASAGPLIGAALAAADQVVIPLTPDYLAFQVSRSLFRIIKAIRQNVNPRLRVAGMFLTMYDTRTRHARDFMTQIHEAYEDVPFFSAVVRQSVKVKEAPSLGQSVLRYAPDSQAAQAYRVIAHEIVNGIASSGVAPVPVRDIEKSLAPVVIATDRATGQIPPIPMLVAANAIGAPTPKPIASATPSSKPIASPTLSQHTQNVPAFLTLNSTAIALPRFEMVPPQIGNGNGNGNGNHAADDNHHAAENHGAAAKSMNVMLAQETRPAPVAPVLPTDPHKALRALIRQVTADSRGVIYETQLARKCEQVLFVSTVKDVEELLQEGALLVEAGFSTLAEKIFERVTELDSTRSEGWLGWARVTSDPLERINRLQKAMYLKPSRELRGELAIARQNLQEHAYTLLEDGTSQNDPEQMSKAHLLFKHAVTLDPSDERAWLGCARTADNLVEKMSYLERARKLNPKNKQTIELYTILGSFVNGEPKERWDFQKAKMPGLILVLVLIGLVSVFIALPWILPPH